VAGITHIVDKPLIAGTMPIGIDFTPMGFRSAGNHKFHGLRAEASNPYYERRLS